MLAKRYKISLDRDFNRIFKEGKSSYSKFFGIKFTPKDKSYSRFSVILSKKVEKNAIRRHYFKRRIFNLLRVFVPDLDFPFDCVIICLPTIKSLSWKEVKDDLDKNLNKLRSKTGK